MILDSSAIVAVMLDEPERADLVIVALFLSLWVQIAASADGLSAAESAAKQGALFGVVRSGAGRRPGRCDQGKNNAFGRSGNHREVANR